MPGAHSAVHGAGEIGYRPEIDGLRAIAVVPVVLFHAGFEVFSGGFVGVDVFFVISGYLITGILLKDIADQRYSIARFYERRARRILPALLVVLACCLPFAWFALLPEEMERFGKSVLAVLGFVSNITFWREEGYFTGASELKPLLHTWSLAVEEQFYIVFPLVLLLLRKASRRTITVLIALAALASFALCEIAAQRWQLANFYLAPTRAWELLAGAWCACLGPRPARGWAGWLGLALIGGAIFGLDGTMPFPSHWALLPVAGTMLLILYAESPRGAGRVLALRPFVGVGLISYSLYLWHQPVFAFARLLSDRAPERATMLALAAVSVVLAVLSWRFVEQPFRRRSGIGRPRVALPLALGAGTVLGGVGALLLVGADLPLRLTPTRDPVLLAMTRSDPFPRATGGDCRPRADDYTAPCTLIEGRPGGPVVAVFGDSHGQALIPAFRALAAARSARLLFSASGGCPPLLGGYILAGNLPPAACPELANAQLNYARRLRPQVIILVGRWSLYTNDDPMVRQRLYLIADRAEPLHWTQADARQALAAALNRTVADYRATGAQVVLVNQVPTQPLALDRALRWAAYRPSSGDLAGLIEQSSAKVREFETRQAVTTAALIAAAHPDGEVVRLDDVFAAGGSYPWAGPGAAWYRDNNHVSRAGAMRLVPRLGWGLERALAVARPR